MTKTVFTYLSDATTFPVGSVLVVEVSPESRNASLPGGLARVQTMPGDTGATVKKRADQIHRAAVATVAPGYAPIDFTSIFTRPEIGHD